jgi:CcmD family protein
MKNTLTFLFFLFLSLSASAQDMASTFRSEGKIYVVVAVAAIVLLGIFFYLMMTDFRLKKLEKEIAEHTDKAKGAQTR